jgi:ATP-dependent Lhr-like helicase
MSSDALHPGIQHHVVNTLGWTSLRHLQQEAVEPVLRGDDALLLAPTAGGKTEAAVFPLLTRMENEGWRGTSVLYVCPLKALLNNLEPRLSTYASWTGRRVGLRHGDTAAGVRKRMLLDPPDILLTTPESLEALLVSSLTTPADLFADLRAIVVDEVHAFAGDDRGWHLLAVLERLTQLAGRPLQRIGLSATVGNPEDLLAWLQGSNASRSPATVVAPAASSPLAPDLTLDYVGTLDNAATVIASLHRGEKRLVFADSRRTVESLAQALRARSIETFVSHSSLSSDERRRAETAFAEARDCVIVSTSTLELGIDVGDLDRVIQIGAPRTVASFLQRLGRTGRRPGSARSMLFLATSDDELLRAAALLLLFTQGYVEAVVPPPAARHVLAQQLLALCLQERRVGRRNWQEQLAGLPLASMEDAAEIADWLVASDHLDVEADMMFVGPEAERRYGHKNFLDLLSVFTADPAFTVLHGREELGSVDPLVMTRRCEGPRVLSLAGRPWTVTYIDWKRRRAFVEPAEQAGVSRWSGTPQPQSYALSNAMRQVLLEAPLDGITLSQRAQTRLVACRSEFTPTVDQLGLVVQRWDASQVRWWTWAGARANGMLAAAMAAVCPGLVDELDRYDNRYVKLRGDATAAAVRDALRRAVAEFGPGLERVPLQVSDEAVKQLKFGELLPPGLASGTLAARAVDPLGVQAVVSLGAL